MYTKHIFSALTLAGLASVASAANPVLVDSAGSGNFTTVQAAISSYASGGSNAGETAPFVIKIKAGSGPYDEGITLDQAVIGQGDIVGDIALESDTSGTKVILKLKLGQTIGTDDGIFINQDVHDVSFRDLIFTRSISTPASMPIDELVRFDESVGNTTMNLISFYNCVFTEVNAAGDPMAVDKASALLPPTPRGGPARSGSSKLLQFFNDAGESAQLILDNCVFYYGASSNTTLRNDGVGPEFIKIHNCLSAYAGFHNFEVGGSNPAAVATITGVDQTEGPLNCTASLFPLVGGHGIAISGSTLGHQTNISHTLIYSEGSAGTPPGTNASRGISGASGQITLSDVIINVPNYGVVDITRVPSTWDRVTINTPTAAYLGIEGSAGVRAAGSLTVKDSIISGAGTKFAGLNATGLPAGGVTVSKSGLPTSGPNAIGAKGTITEVSNINADPAYVSLNGLLATYMDVNGPEYATAGTAGAPLAGGADYVGVANVNDWELY